MVQKSLIVAIHLPNYIRQVKISENVRPKYYEWNGITIQAKGKKLLQKFIKKEDKEAIILNNGNIKPENLRKPYTIVGFKGDKVYSYLNNDREIKADITLFTNKQLKRPTKYILCEEFFPESFEKVIANQTKVNKPRYEIINGQSIYNHTMNPFSLGKIFDAIKEQYYNKFKSIDPVILDKVRKFISKNYPLIIEVELHDTIKNAFDNSKDDIGRRWDVGNRTDPYMKTFLDFLVNGYKDIKPIIEDDDRLHISSGNNSYFFPIKPSEQRKLIFNIYKDVRFKNK